MELSNHETLRLLELLAEKVEESLDGYAFQRVETLLKGAVSERFLGDKYRDVKKAIDPISFQPNKIEPLLNFLGFDRVSTFRRFLEQPIPELLKDCYGTWISVVRQNSFAGFLYQSPVKIFQNQDAVRFQLRGPSYLYEGDVTYRNGCLTVLFSGNSGKQFHHIYKIGSRRKPQFLQGIYSGISTGDDPIGGRCILYRSNEAFEEIENEQLRISELMDSKKELQTSIGHYFESFERNNLRLNPVIAFGVEDLKHSW